jgi:hypothetical protein
MVKLTGFDKKTNRPEFLVGHEDEHDTMVLEVLGDSPTARVWQFIWEWQDSSNSSFSVIASRAGISRNSLYKIWPFFKDNEIIIPTKYEKGTQFYSWNKKSPFVRSMVSLLNTALRFHITKQVAVEEAMDKFMVYETRKSKHQKTAKL